MPPAALMEAAKHLFIMAGENVPATWRRSLAMWAHLTVESGLPLQRAHQQYGGGYWPAIKKKKPKPAGAGWKFLFPKVPLLET
jgi:hypothetical protein